MKQLNKGKWNGIPNERHTDTNVNQKLDSTNINGDNASI